MLKQIHKPFLFLFFSSVLISSFGQSANNSPFSSYGLGDIHDGNLMHLQQMSGISAAFADQYHLNLKNPASLPYLRATSFDLGVFARYANLSDQSNSSTNWSGNLEYISLAFPFRNPLNEAFDRVKKNYWIGMNFSLIPFSDVNYDLSSIEENTEFGSIERNYSGSGGSYKFMWGTGIRYKDLSFGLNLGYLFGSINHERNINFLEISNSYQDNFIDEYSLRGFVWNAGLMYIRTLNKDEINSNRNAEPNLISIGLFGNSKSKFSTTSNQIYQNVYNPSFNETYYDTINAQIDIEGRGTLPSELGAGFVYYGRNKYSLGFQYLITQWSQYENDAFSESLLNSQKVSFGGYYRPNYKSFKFSDRVFYRFGMFYEKGSKSINDERVNNYGLSFGLGLPFIYQRKISHMNLGISVGKRGKKSSISETYVKLGLSLTFNDDEWFIKRKYN